MQNSIIRVPEDGVVLLFGAHPDDIFIGAGGLIGILSKLNVSLHWYVYTGSGSRLNEERNIAATVGAQFQEIERYPDAYLPNHWGDILEHMKEIREKLKQEGKSVELILCPSLDDRHQDHRTVAAQVPRVFRSHRIMEYEVPSYDGDPSPKTCFVPLTPAEAEAKVDLLMECYPSRREHIWWKPSTFMAYMNIRGLQSNAVYAEGFNCKKTVLSFEDHR